MCGRHCRRRFNTVLLFQAPKMRLNWLLLFLHQAVLGLPETIKIGGLFDMTDTVQEIAFRYAVDKVNLDREVLPRTRLMAQIERIPPQDSFYASKQGAVIYRLFLNRISKMSYTITFSKTFWSFKVTAVLAL